MSEDTTRELAWLRRARELSHALVDEARPRDLLPRILASAIELAGAERGFLVRLDQGQLRVAVATGFDGVDLSGVEGAVSRRVVEEVLSRAGPGVVTTREEDRGLLDATTMRERRVVAILCVPMRLRGETVGVIYLDHRFLADAFRAEDIEPLRLFADQAALAIESDSLTSERQEGRRELDRVRERLQEHEALERRRRRLQAVQRAHRERGEGGGLGELVGESEAAQGLFADLERASRSLDPVLIVGEAGAGKSAVADELHRLSARSEGPCPHLLCATASPDELREALAQGGSVVLEGIGRAPAALREALLLALQSHHQDERAARLIATHTGSPTELDLPPELLYRLDVLRLDVPALRHRREDVPLLLDHLSDAAGRRLELTPNALRVLSEHAWPGNLHELGNLVRRLLALEKTITTRDLPLEIRDAEAALPGADVTLAEMEKAMVLKALEDCGGNKARAARRLGVQRSTLYRLLDRHELR